MKLSLEKRALGWASLAALLSVGSAWLAAKPIKMMTSFDSASSTASSRQTFPETSASAELASQGHEFFEMSCSQCHGDDAHGDEGPDLHNLTISNARITATIKKGIKGEMPTFAKKYNDRQIESLVNYLRTLR